MLQVTSMWSTHIICLGEIEGCDKKLSKTMVQFVRCLCEARFSVFNGWRPFQYGLWMFVVHSYGTGGTRNFYNVEANPFNWNQFLAETLPDATPAGFPPTFVSIGVTGMQKPRKCHLGRIFFSNKEAATFASRCAGKNKSTKSDP